MQGVCCVPRGAVMAVTGSARDMRRASGGGRGGGEGRARGGGLGKETSDIGRSATLHTKEKQIGETEGDQPVLKHRQDIDSAKEQIVGDSTPHGTRMTAPCSRPEILSTLKEVHPPAWSC